MSYNIGFLQCTFIDCLSMYCSSVELHCIVHYFLQWIVQLLSFNVLFILGITLNCSFIVLQCIVHWVSYNVFLIDFLNMAHSFVVLHCSVHWLSFNILFIDCLSFYCSLIVFNYIVDWLSFNILFIVLNVVFIKCLTM